MNDILSVIYGLIAGFGLGLFFVASLRWTVWRLPQESLPWPFYFASLIVRMAILLGGFVLLATSGDWRIMLAALAGFVLIRAIGVRWVTHEQACT